MTDFEDIDEMSAWIDQPEVDADAEWLRVTERWISEGEARRQDADQREANAWRKDLMKRRLAIELAWDRAHRNG